MPANQPEAERLALDGGLLDAISRRAETSPRATREAFDAALPAALYAIVERGASEDGARELLEEMHDGRLRELDTRELYRALDEPILRERTVSAARACSRYLFGDRLSGVERALSDVAPLGRKGADLVLALASSLALGVIGTRVRSHALDARGLALFLVGQKPAVAASVPPALRGALGFEGASYEEHLLAGTTPTTTYEHHPWIWIVRWAALAVIVLGMPFAVIHNVSQDTAPPEPEQPSLSTTPGRAPATTAPQIPPVPLRSNAPSVRRLASVLDGKSPLPQRIPLDGVDFRPLAEKPRGGGAIVSDVAALLAARPTARLGIEGQTGASVDAGLAERRAEAIKEALVRQGIHLDRVEVMKPGPAGASQGTSAIDLVLLSR